MGAVMNDEFGATTHRRVGPARPLIHRYAFGLDHEDWDLWRTVFADEVTMDMSDYQPEPPPRVQHPPTGWSPMARVLFAGLERSQHFIGSHRYAIDGDRGHDHGAHAR